MDSPFLSRASLRGQHCPEEDRNIIMILYCGSAAVVAAVKPVDKEPLAMLWWQQSSNNNPAGGCQLWWKNTFIAWLLYLHSVNK